VPTAKVVPNIKMIYDYFHAKKHQCYGRNPQEMFKNQTSPKNSKY